MNPLIQKKDYGYRESSIIREGDKKHHLKGALQRTTIFPDGHGWGDYLPQSEVQRNNSIDPNTCVIHATDHAVATFMKKAFGGTWDFAERFLAILSGQNGTGGDPHVACETLRKNGQIDEKDLPFNESIDTLDKYFSPNPMSQDLAFKGKNLITKYNFGHEWLLDFDNLQNASVYAPILKEALKSGTISIAVFAWASRNLQDQQEGICYRPEGEPDTHLVELYDFEEGKYWLIWDSYNQFKKKLEWNFGFSRAKLHIVTEKSVTEQKITIYQRLLNTMSWLLALLQINKLGRLFVHQGD